jgi:ABC-type antimicrobial peptide transport system permease subunit
MSDTKVQSGGGVGFCGLLTVLFIGLKLTGHIAWSWWWVLSPITIPLAIVLTILIAVLLVALGHKLITDK